MAGNMFDAQKVCLSVKVQHSLFKDMISEYEALIRYGGAEIPNANRQGTADIH